MEQLDLATAQSESFWKRHSVNSVNLENLNALKIKNRVFITILHSYNVNSLVIGPGQKVLSRVRSDQFFDAWVGTG